MAMSDINALSSVTQIVSVGSVDGILTSAALLRIIGNTRTALVFAQAFTVDKIDITGWAPNSKVAFIDLAVNNRDKSMTANFVKKIADAGHQLVAVIDEHSREDWQEVLGSYMDLEDLAVEPQSQNSGPEAPKSSGEVLRRALAASGKEVDNHLSELLLNADKADKMDFNTHFGDIANKAVKSKIGDDSRRVYLARYLAVQYKPDETINDWIKEYDAIIANHSAIEDAKVDLGDGMVRICTVGKTVDMTTLLSALYRTAKVVLMEGEFFDKAAGKKTRQLAFGTGEKIDLLMVLRTAGIAEASGFAQKVNVSPTSEEAAIKAIRHELKTRGFTAIAELEQKFAQTRETTAE